MNPKRVSATAAVLAVLLIAAPLAGMVVARIDDFFESELDGSWVGTFESGGSHFLMQLNLDVDDDGGLAFVILQDSLTAAPAGIDVFDGTITSVDADSVEVDFDSEDPLARGAAAATLDLDYDAAAGTLGGTIKGAASGDVTLRRMDVDRPLQKLWSGTLKVGGENRFVLLELTETESGTGRFAAIDVGGHAWFGDEEGTVAGSRSGNNVDFTITLPSGDVVADLALKKKSTQLKGSVDSAGESIRTKLVPAAGVGKPMKVRPASPNTIDAGATTEETGKGRQFSKGALVHTDTTGVTVDSVSLRSPKAIEVMLTTAADVADGTKVSLRVVNADGQVGERKNALTVAGDTGGGLTVSFAADVQPIFTNNCDRAGCHSTASRSAGMVLAAGSAFANIVNVSSSQQPSLNRITPGNADNSYLVRKIRGDSGISGGRMPLNQTPLTAAQINTIVTWVNEGANNN